MHSNARWILSIQSLVKAPGNCDRIPTPRTYHLSRRNSATCGAAEGKNQQ